MGPWRVVGAADYLGHPAPDGTPTTADGSADLVIWNRVTGQLGVWVGDGSGGCWAHPMSWTDARLPWEPRVIANLDGKNFSEIVWEQPLTGQLAYTRLLSAERSARAHRRRAARPRGALAGGWVIRAADDFNGDGYEDLVFQHTGSQKAVVWLHGRPPPHRRRLHAAGPADSLPAVLRRFRRRATTSWGPAERPRAELSRSPLGRGAARRTSGVVGPESCERGSGLAQVALGIDRARDLRHAPSSTSTSAVRQSLSPRRSRRRRSASNSAVSASSVRAAAAGRAPSVRCAPASDGWSCASLAW